MPRLPISGSDIGTWGDILNEFLLVAHNADGTSKLTSTANTFTAKQKFKATAESTDSFQVLDAEDTPVLSVDTQNRAVGMGVGAPSRQLHLVGSSTNGLRIDRSGSPHIELVRTDATANKQRWRVQMGTDVGETVFQIYPTDDAGGGRHTNPPLSIRGDTGTLGLGVAPKIWGNNNTALQIGGTGSLDANTVAAAGGPVHLINNAYWDGTNWKYIFGDEASIYSQFDGIHRWRTTASGLADGNITWTDSMQLNGSGNLGIGTTSISAKLHLRYTSATDEPLKFENTAASGRTYVMGPGVGAGAGDFGLRDATGSVNRLMIKSSGLVGVNNDNPDGQLQVNTASASTVPLIAKGAASQTADLQQWQNSTGSSLSFIGNSGYFYAVNGVYTGSSSTGSTAQNAFYSNDTSEVVTVVRGAASQTANLQEWQDSSGNVKAHIGPGGTIYARTDSTPQLQLATAGGGAFFTVSTNTASNPIVLVDPGSFASNRKLLVMKGHASQSEDLTQWQNSAGTVRAQVTANGNFLIRPDQGTAEHVAGINSYSAYIGPANAQGGGTVTATFNVTTHAAATVGAVVRGNVSQSADLQQWQSSDGTVRSRILASGQFRVSASTGRHIDVINSSSATLFSIDNDGFAGFNRGLGVTGGTYGVALGASSATASDVALQVNAAASQTADLTQWRDSASNVLGRVNKNGVFITKVNSAPVDADISAGEMALWFDQTNGAAKLMIKAKQADGTVRTGQVALT